MSQTAVIVLVVVLTAAVFAVLAILLVRAVLRRRRRLAETGELKKDLMAWRNIRALAQGGDAARRAKADLSARLGQLRSLFSLGLRRLHEQHGDRDLPWLLLLGEPDSGKSSLLANAGLEFQATVRHDADEKQSLVPWVGPSAYVLDVGGRVFFDRWLEGSGAEWDDMLTCVRRRRPGKPLEGVILCVPADALVADDAALTREKTSLVSAELRRLTARLGVNVPCHLVVTKCDMLLGWREFFENLSEKERARALGWRNDHPERPFDAAAFETWWGGAIGALRDDLDARLLPEFAVERAAERMGTKGRAFLLAESFGNLRANLDAYLGRIFGSEAWHGCEQLLLSGVYFTSAVDTGTVLSPEYAALQGKRTEEAPIQGPARETFGGFFIRDFMHDMAAGRRLPSSFTPRALFRRQFGWYLAAAVLVAQGVIFLTMAIGSKGWLTAGLAEATAYYEHAVERFRQNDFANAPLLAVDTNGVVSLLDDEPMPGADGMTRARYLHLARTAAEEPLLPGFGWNISSLVRFGLNLNAGVEMRRTIFNRILADMVFLPAVRSFEQHELKTSPSAFSVHRRDAFFAYNDLSGELGAENEADLGIDRFLTYIVPGANPEIMHLLTSYYPGYGSRRDFSAHIAYDLDYIPVERRLYRDFFRGWADLSIYPETIYPAMRGLVTNAFACVRANGEVLRLTALLGADPVTNGAMLATLRTTVSDQDRRMKALAAGASVLPTLTSMLTAFNEAGQKRPEDVGPVKKEKRLFQGGLTEQVADPLAQALSDYRSRLASDRDTLLTDVRASAAQLSDRRLYAYFETLTPELLANRFNEIGERLDLEGRNLQAMAKEVRSSGFIRRLKVNEGKTAELETDDYAGSVQRRLYAAVGGCFSDARLEDPLLLGQFLSAERIRADEVQAALTSACGNWSGDPTVVPVLAALRKLARAQSEANRMRILRDYVAVHPKTAAEIGTLVSRLAESEPAEMAAVRTAAEAELGPLGLRGEYSHYGAQNLFRAYGEVCALMAPPAADGKGGKEAAKTAAPELPGYDAVREAMTDYLAGYIDYCSRVGDSLSVDFGEDWSAYRAHCVRIKPYTINTFLQVFYGRTREMLRSVPETCLTPELKKARDAGIAGIEARLLVLNDAFTKTCIRQTSSWALLPTDPVAASALFREMPAKTLLTDYLAVFGTEGNRSTVPWWTSFFMHGLQLTQGAAFRSGEAALRKDGCRYMRFPLCRDPVDPGDVLTAAELESVREALLSCGCAAQPAVKKSSGTSDAKAASGEAAAPADESGNPALALARNARLLARTGGGASQPPVDPARGSQVIGLVDALTRDRFETVWTLSVLPVDKCAELQLRHFQMLPLTTVRFRYGLTTYAGKARNDGVALDGRSEVVLARGDLGDADVAIHLREFSDMSEDGAVLDFPGAWAALRIYLSKRAVYDPVLKAVCIPLVVTDRHGSRSVLWTRMAFNRPVPKPDEWPSTEKWLDSVVTSAK